MWSRTFAGLLLGFTLACALGGLYTVLGPQAHGDNLIVALLAMLPLWIAAWSLAYAGRSAARAWAWLGMLNLAAYGLLWLARHHHWNGWGA